MLTPQAVAEKTFTKARFGGYTMTEVDDFLDVMTQDYTALVEENAALKNNLKVLADRINEYRDTETAMRATLRAAQKTANEMVAEAEQKREAILDALELDIRTRKEAYDQEIAACHSQLAAARKQTLDYLAAMQDLTDQQQAFLNSINNVGEAEEEAPAAEPAPVEAPAPAAEAPVAEAAPVEETPIEDSVFNMIAEEAAAAPQAPAEEDFAATSRIDFANLKFGKDYEIK